MHALIWEERFEVLEGVNKVVFIRFVSHLFGVQVTVPEGVVTESDDVKIQVVPDQFIVVIGVVSGVRRPIGVYDDLRLGAHFAHGIASGMEQTEVSGPVIPGFVIGVHLNAAETVHDLVTHLYQIRCSIGAFQRRQHAACVGAYAIRHRSIRGAFPCRRCLNMCGIYPGVGIMKIQHEIRSCRFDSLAQFRHKRQILTNGGVECPVLVCFSRVDKDAYTERVPTAICYCPCDQIVDSRAIHIFVVR